MGPDLGRCRPDPWSASAGRGCRRRSPARSKTRPLGRCRKYIERGLEPPSWPGPRPPPDGQGGGILWRYLRERLAAFPQLSGRRLHREVARTRLLPAATAFLTDFLLRIRPDQTGVLRGALRDAARAPTPQSTSHATAWCSLTGRARNGSSGCPRWCSATAACCRGRFVTAPGPAEYLLRYPCAQHSMRWAVLPQTHLYDRMHPPLCQ